MRKTTLLITSIFLGYLPITNAGWDEQLAKHDTAQTFSDQIKDEHIINNRLFLLVAASKVGLVNYPYEY